jgi:RNA polymerase sigma factor (sigma-70 family)
MAAAPKNQGWIWRDSRSYIGVDLLTLPDPRPTLAGSGIAARRPAAGALHRHAVPDASDSISPALDAILARFGIMLRHIARQRGVADDELAEVMQNLRLRLWRAHREGSAIARLGSSYIYHAGISAALDVIRERRARGNQMSLAALAQDPPAPDSTDPAARVERSDDARVVAEAIRTLPEARRVPVRMHLAGYTREEIARHLGWSEAKMRNLLYRGLEDLRAELRRRGVGPGGSTG